jgi:archaellum component FlaF (FlaF/FlaG flagellin family)
MATSTSTGRAIAAGTILGSPPPNITGFEPHHGEIRAQVTITGTGLIDVNLVQFNGVDAMISPGLRGDTSLTVTVPDQATSGPIRVCNGQGSCSTSTDSFTVDPPRPELDSVTPAAAPPGTLLKLTGRHLAVVGLTVTFEAVNGSFSAPPMAQMPQSLTVVVPQGAAPGSARIVVMTQYDTASIPFKVKR